MEELKIHRKGQDQHLKAIKATFESFKKSIKLRSDLTQTEKEDELVKAKESFLKEKKELRDKLF